LALASKAGGAGNIGKVDVTVHMLVCFSFECKPGMEKEFAAALSDPEMGHRVALAMGASRNMLFVRDGRMVRVFEFPEGATPVPIMEIARSDEAVGAFLRSLAPLLKEPFDLSRPETLDAFNKRNVMPVVYDVKA
jgi:hypothetical protein